MFTEAYFRTTSNIHDGAFFTLVKGYFKNVLDSVELPLGSIVYTIHTVVKKLTAEKFERKSLLLTMEQFLSKFQNYARCHHRKMNKGFLN